MIHSSPTHSPTTRSRRSTLLSAPTTQAMCAFGILTTAFCGTSTAFGRSPTRSSTRTYIPGSRIRVGLGSTARCVIVPVSLLTCAALKSTRPGTASSEPSGRMKRAVFARSSRRSAPLSNALRSTIASRSGVVNDT